MKGRKPKPTPLKVLAGERPDRVNPAGPRPRAGRPTSPPHLDPAARAEWDQLVAILDEMGILSAALGPALTLYCLAFSRHALACKDLATSGLTIETDLGGVKANPAAAIAKGAEATMARMLAEFGLTPASRSRVAVPTDGPRDELGEFLKRKA